MQPSEYQLQRAFCLWFGGELGKIQPAARRDVVWWHTPNGGTRRDSFEGKRLKDIGLLAGVPDLLFLRRGQLFAMEWKAPGESPSAVQRALYPRLTAAGIMALEVVDNLPRAKQLAFAWGLSVTDC